MKPKASTGATGRRGPRGAKGATGVSGPRGMIGNRGRKGMKGRVGASGHQGLKGHIGKPGHKGPNGMRGPLQQDDALDRIVSYFDDVHAELMDHAKAIALMQKAIADLLARMRRRRIDSAKWPVAMREA